MQGSHRVDGAVGVVGAEADVVCLRHCGNLLEFEDAARVTDVRLRHVNDLLLEKLSEAPFCVDALASGDWDVNASGYLGHGVDVFGWDRLLKPERAVFFERVAHANCLVGREPAVDLYEQLNIVTNCFAHRLDFGKSIPFGLDCCEQDPDARMGRP